MPKFHYSARQTDGRKVTGELEASSAESAAETLLNQGMIPVDIQRKSSVKVNIRWRDWIAPSVPLEVLVIFCRQFYSLTKAGIPLLRALRGLTQNCQNKQLQQALEETVSELTNGRSLAAAMQLTPKVFSPLFVSMIQIGESTGRLDQSLLQLSEYYEKELETRKQIKTALRYPILVLGFVGVALFILNLKVIPQFADMFLRFGANLPLPTRILIATSQFFVNYWLLMCVAFVGGVLGFQAWINTAIGREKWDKFRLTMPIVGSIVNRAQLSRFARTFSLMLSAGVPLNHSLALSAQSLGNAYLEKRLLEMKAGIESGTGVFASATQTGVFTPLVLQMIAVGEETGRIDELLLEVSEFYEREVDYDLKTLTARIEPILLVIVAGMVLILALGIFLPMWGMMDAIKGQ